MLSGLSYRESLPLKKELLLFFSLSLLLHFVLALFVYSYAMSDQRTIPPFFARVVTPEEFESLSRKNIGNKEETNVRTEKVPALPGIQSQARQSDSLSGPGLMPQCYRVRRI